ncbi:hypothetical protein BDZ89DRAFT_1140870 [Hymenopellis radicata]|nr:hypothetical protein BDZ89DRAFT_1140870 [Hymenopellis radicata]
MTPHTVFLSSPSVLDSVSASQRNHSVAVGDSSSTYLPCPLLFHVFPASTRKLKCYESPGSTFVRVCWGEHHGVRLRCESRTAHYGDCANQAWDVGARVA